MTVRVGVFGGTFDPIHVGHLAAAEDARGDLGLDRVMFVPNALPPHKRGNAVSPVGARVEMVRLAIADNPHFVLSLVEVERGGFSYTLDTLRELRGALPSTTRLTFLTGWEALSQLHTWHRPDEILTEFDIALIDRPIDGDADWTGAEERFPGLRSRVRVVNVPKLEISSDAIRYRVRTGLSIRYYVPEAVRTYIQTHHLYVDSYSSPSRT